MWNKSKSLGLSYLTTILLFFILVAGGILLPGIVKQYFYFFERNDLLLIPILVLLYACLIPAFCAVVSLFLLLRNISKSVIFVAANVKLLRLLSWCCFAVAFLFLGFGYMYLFGLFVSFAAVFFGLILRVIKNVFEKAIELKEENEYTI